MIKDSGIYVAQNTESNLNNNVGQFSSCTIGNNIMLGTDGMHSDMLRAAKATFYNGQLRDTINYEQAYKRFRNIHNYINTNEFKGDGENNLVVLDYEPQTDFNQSNFLGHFLFGWDSTNIEHVIANGRLIVNNKQVTTIDEQALKQHAREMSKILWDKMHTVAV